MANKVRLKVVEALADDAYKGIARIDTETMRELGIKRGDVILIKGSRETVAIADRAYPADVGEGIIRMDGILRRNAKVGIGDPVEIIKAEIKEAKKIIIAPAQKGVMVQADQGALRRGLLGRALIKGDVIVLGGVQRRRDLFSEMGMDDEMGNIFGEMFNNMGFGNLGGGLTQIKFLVVSTSPNQPVYVSENTEVSLSPKAVELSEEKIPEITYEDIGGLEEEVKKIREMVEIPMKHPEIFEKLGIEPPKGVLLHGPPGTGKTLLAKAVANETEANFILLNGPEIMSKFYGESEKRIREIFDEAEKTAPAIIFIDEIDAIAPKREDVQGEVERRVVSQILTMMDGLKSRGNVIVIGATNRVNAIDQALRRPGRFDREIEVGVPDKKGRRTILGIHTRGMPLTKNVNLDELAGVTHGFVGADLESLTKEAAMIVLRKFLPKMKLDADETIPQDILEKLIINQEDFTDALKVVRPSAMREVLVETPNVGWSDVGGLDNVRQELQEAVEWPLKYPESFDRLGIRPSRGILLYGPPGTGKTLLAKAVAKESEANFIQVKGPELLSMWVGKSLPYNEELIVKDNGIVKRMKIGEIVENKLDVQVLAFDKDKRIRFTKIGDYIKHKLDSKLMEVTTRTGRKIKVTDYHSLFSFVNGQLADVPTSQLIPNESYIAIPKNLSLPREEIKEINLYHYFKDDGEIFVTNVKGYLERAKKLLGLDKTATILNVSKKYLADIVSKNLPVEITEFNALIRESKLALDFEEVGLKLKGSAHSYKSIFKLTPDFWRVVGLWIAEGDFNSDTVRIHNINAEIREDLRAVCKEYGFKLSEMKSCATINSYFLQKVFKKIFGLFSGSRNKSLPTLSFILDKESKANLLRGYFSGDGSIHQVERGKYAIEASSVSKRLANDLLYMLLDFGIVASCYTKKNKFGEVYRINILGVKNFERFSEVGFIDKRRNEMIMAYVKSRKWARSDLIPLSGKLYELASSQNSVYNTNTSIGKEALKSMLVLVDKDKIKYKEYWDLVEGDIYFDLVKEIKVIDNEDYVYDIHVPGEQNFVGGFGGVIAHNSEEGMRKVFERARQVAPCIVFFDELDALAGKRGVETGTRVTERVLNQMLAEMDGLEDLKSVLVIGATNRPDMLDPGLLRPGRFDKILLVSAPTEDGRKKILEIHTRKMPIGNGKKLFTDKEREKFWDEFAKKTEGYTGADIEALVREAAMLALRESKDASQVKKENFDEALGKIKPSVTKATIDVYKKVEDSFLKSAKAAVPMENSYFG
ncbi:CDC48 family AAA ATPase [Candidatus Pacearchaeota archaeon]|nr:CDC48 family AAA ATPase [Candidatus Pacearchaeota archaeon]